MGEFETLTEILRKELMNKYRELYDVYSKKYYKNQEQDDCEDQDYSDYQEQEYDKYEDQDYSDYDEQEYDEYEDQNCDDSIDYDKEDTKSKEDRYDEDVLGKLVNYIINSKYKNLFKLIILNDVYEYIKSKEISELALYTYEEEMLEKLENDDLNDLLDKIKRSENFFDDLVAVFLEYNQNTLIEQDKYKNIKLIELSNNIDKLQKFKIHIFDDLQFQYKKTRKKF